MADPLSIASGVVALVTFGLHTSKALCTAIESLKTHTKTVRDLKAEVLALSTALEELKDAVADDAGEFDKLKLPLLSCAVLCQEFSDLVRTCTDHTTETRISFRDWTKLQFKGHDIESFRTVLAGYKSTIQITIGGINLRSMQITQACFREYRDLIEDAKADLHEHLFSIEQKLSPNEEADLQVLQTVDKEHLVQEKESALQCLHICSEVLEYIEKRRTMISESSHQPSMYAKASATGSTSLPSSGDLTATALRDCRDRLETTSHGVGARMRALQEALPVSSIDSSGTAEKERVQACLALCEDALREADQSRINVYEDISVADNGGQYLVSTIGELISAKRVSAGSGSIQIMGQMSDETLQMHFSRRESHERTAKAEKVSNEVEQPYRRWGKGYQL